MSKINVIKFIVIFTVGCALGGGILCSVLLLSQSSYAAVLGMMSGGIFAMFFIMFACDKYLKDYIDEFHKREEERLHEMEETAT